MITRPSSIYRDGFDAGIWHTAQPDSPRNVALAAQFAKNHPEVVNGIAYEAGRQAREDGLPLTACPYIEGYEATEWRNGWHGLASQWAPVAMRRAA